LVLEIGLLKECVKKERDQLRAQLETLKAERNAAGMRERNGMLVIVEKWKAYAERLEEAGDLMHWYCADPDAVDVWNQAKEAKP
jgi:extradiol dioxygenase family protein